MRLMRIITYVIISRESKKEVNEMAVVLVKAGEVKDRPKEIEIPDKLNIPWRHIGGSSSISKEEREKLEKEFKNPQAIVLKFRKALGLEVPKKEDKK